MDAGTRRGTAAVAAVAAAALLVSAAGYAWWVLGNRALGTVLAYDRESSIVVFDMKATTGLHGTAALLLPGVVPTEGLATVPHVHGEACGHDDTEVSGSEAYFATYDAADPALSALSVGDIVLVSVDAEGGNRVLRVADEAE